MKNRFKVIGLMSGTSLDGLDIACTEFKFTKSGWTFSIIRAETLAYPKKWRELLTHAHKLPAAELMALHGEYGAYLGDACKSFIYRHELSKIDFIASHGHTVFHQPDKKFTFQIGDGSAIHAHAGIPVISDFRSLDVSLNGQGAPLVPVGDKLLFEDYDVCVNLGGIANISRDESRIRIAYDVSFCNMSLNYLMGKEGGKRYDANGETAARGSVDKALLRKLRQVYQPLKRKRTSLGREIFETRIQPLLDDKELTLEDKLATCVESTAIEIVDAIVGPRVKSVLFTGGGVYNAFLMSRVLEHCQDRAELVIPEDDVVQFKEALIFGFLGVLRVMGKANTLRSVTGASRDSSGGVMIGFKM